MVPTKKLPSALFAVHAVLVKARWLAGEGADPQKLYRLLDWAELLPSLISCREDDTTEEFRETLVGLGNEFPECAGLLQNFDNNIAWDRSKN